MFQANSLSCFSIDLDFLLNTLQLIRLNIGSTNLIKDYKNLIEKRYRDHVCIYTDGLISLMGKMGSV